MIVISGYTDLLSLSDFVVAREIECKSLLCVSDELTSQFIGPKAMHDLYTEVNFTNNVNLDVMFHCGNYAGMAIQACDLSYRYVLFNGSERIRSELQSVYPSTKLITMADLMGLGVKFFDIQTTTRNEDILKWYTSEYRQYKRYIVNISGTI